jgi:DNA polymerase I
MPNLKEDIARSGAKTVILFGSEVFEFVIGKKIKAWGGRRIERDGVAYYGVYSPRFSSKSKERQREARAQIEAVMKSVKSGGRLDLGKYVLHSDPMRMVARFRYLSKVIDSVQAFDYETTGLEPKEGEVTCVSISSADKFSEMFWFADLEGEDKRIVYEAYTQWLLSPVPKVAQNAKFECRWSLQHFGTFPVNLVGDTQQMHHLLHEDMTHRLTNLAYQYTEMGGYDTPMMEFLEAGNHHHDAKKEFMLQYSAGDSDCTRRVYQAERKEIDADAGLKRLEKDIVLPAVYTLARVEHNGMRVDIEKAKKVVSTIKTDVSNKKDILIQNPDVKRYMDQKGFTDIKCGAEGEDLGKCLNINSAIQMKDLYFSYCGLPKMLIDGKESDTTNKKFVAKVKDLHEVPSLVFEMRNMLYQLDDLETIVSRVRSCGTMTSDYIHSYVVTGRLSSRNPNLQNIPNDSDVESYVKTVFCSRFDDGVIIASDYSQLELRLAGGESNDQVFIDSYKKGIDMHTRTGTAMFHCGLEDVTKNQRNKAKRVNFGVVYGITGYGLSAQLDETEEVCDEYLDAFWSQYTGLKSWMDNIEKQVAKDGFVRNRFGRMRRLPDVKSSVRWVREGAIRQAGNFIIQSLGADTTMFALTRLNQAFERKGMRSVAIGQIHDSILVDSPRDEINEVIKTKRHCMITAPTVRLGGFGIPLEVDHEAGFYWSDMQKLKLE